jgi:hypothetical protein
MAWINWPWNANAASTDEREDDVWRVWQEQLPKFVRMEPIARQLCLEFGQDPDGYVGDPRQPNWQYQASELEALRQRIMALRRAGLLD